MLVRDVIVIVTREIRVDNKVIGRLLGMLVIVVGLYVDKWYHRHQFNIQRPPPTLLQLGIML